jgi:hypothetical protein
MYLKEPSIDEATNTLYWINLNQVIEGYFFPNYSLSIYYDVQINGSSTLTNTVTVNAITCGNCSPLTDSATATINATFPSKKFAVDIIPPEHTYTYEYIVLEALISNGTPPYTIYWDLDNDMLFEEINKTTIFNKWEETGKYIIRVKAIDNMNQTCTKTIELNVTIEPLIIDIGGPYYGITGEFIVFNSYTTGGMGNYSWTWDFDDGNHSSLKNPLYAYPREGTYVIKAEVTDDRNISVTDLTYAYITKPDLEPPIISMISPINAIYFKNKPIFPFFKPLIIGAIEINISAKDNDSSIQQMEFYINNKLAHTTNKSSLLFQWNETYYGKQIISVISIDSNGNKAVFEKTIWKFF